MKPLDENENIICEKCGIMHDAGWPPQVDYACGVFDPNHQMNLPISEMGEIKEYFIRTCRRCGYKWAEGLPGKG